MPPDKQILLKLKGKFVDIMCDVNPEHKTNEIEEKNQKVLYLWVTIEPFMDVLKVRCYGTTYTLAF